MMVKILKKYWLIFLIILLPVLNYITFHSASKEVDYNTIKQEELVKASVSKWIKNHSLYPESYEKIKFFDYKMSVGSRADKRIAGSEFYKIGHRFKIRNKDSIVEMVNRYFYLDYEYYVNVITKKKEIFQSKYPPDWRAFMDSFGRELNKNDSMDLISKLQKVEKKKMLDRFEEAPFIESYDITNDEEELEVLRNILKKHSNDLNDSILNHILE